VPIVGISFLHWNPWTLLVIYYVDTMVPFAGLMALEGRAPDGSKAPVTAFIMICIFATLFGGPIVFFGWRDLQLDWRLAVAALIQAAIAGRAFLRTDREMNRRLEAEASESVREQIGDEYGSRFATPLVRWFAVFGAFALMGPWPVAIIVVYLCVTVYLELRPLRVS
jgi:hypothetical protein